ncbi:hypothetical protein LBMAG42_23010 [Deltaproteobacteria bacterium]|nr:hypothetical protein LBMAG42_23010 [Deltaproteobacteria bacterium]
MNAHRALLSLAVLLTACDAIPEDTKFVQARYQGYYSQPCPAWLKSPVSGRMYCSSPHKRYDTTPAYVAAKPVVNEDAFAGFEAKTADEQKALLIAEGEKVYTNNCVACHQANGTGSGTSFPPLVASPAVTDAAAETQVATILKGLSGKEIGGVMYTGAMTPFGGLSDSQIASVATYERNSWGNDAGVVLPALVADVRKR